MGIIFLWLSCLLLFQIPAFADYEQDLRDQISEIKKRHRVEMDRTYFRDMGIVASKADDAELNLLATEIVSSLLFRASDQYVQEEIDLINRLYPRDGYKASNRMVELNRFERLYQPTEEFLSTTGGQTFSAELVQLRSQVLDFLGGSCSEYMTVLGLQALRKTGLFVTNRSKEIAQMRELTQELNCCLAWKSKIHYYHAQEFRTDYEEGIMIEEAWLKLRSSPRDYSQAKWEGEWIYRFEGREGKGLGKSNATLQYRKGKDMADLVISSAKLTSAGRINLPITPAGDHRFVAVEGSYAFPAALFSNQVVIQLTGCRENKV